MAIQNHAIHRDIEPLELLIDDTAAAIGPKQITSPVCLGCLEPVQTQPKEETGSDVEEENDGVFWCPSCNFPLCSAECSRAPLHTTNECTVFPR